MKRSGIRLLSAALCAVICAGYTEYAGTEAAAHPSDVPYLSAPGSSDAPALMVRTAVLAKLQKMIRAAEVSGEVGKEASSEAETEVSQKDAADGPGDDMTVNTEDQNKEKPKKKKIIYVTYQEYFSRSLFIGDSICSGLKVFSGLLPVENVAAAGNVAARSLDSYTFRYRSDSYAELDAYSIAELYRPEDIYLWMGMNDINVITEEKYVERLREISEKLKKVSPDSRIHIISISPITRGHRWNSGSGGTSRINKYNAAVEKACNEEGFADYIDIICALADSDGYLIASYSSGDGMHLGVSAYKSVMKEIIAHNNKNHITYSRE